MSNIPSRAYRNGVGARHEGKRRSNGVSDEWLRGWDHADADLTGCAIDAGPKPEPVTMTLQFEVGEHVVSSQYGHGKVVKTTPNLVIDFDGCSLVTGRSPQRVAFTGDTARDVQPDPPPPPTSKLTGVGGFFCASHSPNGAPVHGHTWEVTAWFPSGDGDALRDRLNALLKRWDHTHLPDEIAWGEDLAEHIGFLLPGCVRVQVSRPAERIYAEWRLV